MRKLRLFPVVTVVSVVMALLQPDPVRANPDPVNVTVTILRFIQIQDPDPAPLQGDGDYYAKVRTDGFGFQSTFDVHQDDVPDISPYWTFTRTVDSSLGSVPITIQMWDHDSGLAAPDDVIDLNQNDGVQDLSLSLNLGTGTWSGDVPLNVGFAQGDGDHNEFGLTEGGEAGKILFDISLSGNGDIDGDGIPDGVERFGARDANGNLVANMAALGADPCRKTIALEIDWMAGAADGHTHRPTDAAVNDAIGAMNAAPINAVSPCPYAGFPQQPAGVNLVIDRSNAIPEQATFPLSSLAGTRDSGNFNPGRRPYFHYVLFVHDQSAGNSSSGRCCVDDRDFIVSLGSWANQVGTFRDQSGSILHELGHSLGLGHGGNEGRNYKPNYVSVMNYFFDPTGIPDPNIPANIDTDGDGTPDQSFRLDYSRADLSDLVEGSISEGAGIANGTDFTFWFDPTYSVQSGQGNGALDWDFDGSVDAAPVSVDLNAEPCVGAGANGTIDSATGNDDVVVPTGAGPIVAAGTNSICNTTATGDDSQDLAVGASALTALTGWDDWQNLSFRAAMAGAGAPSVSHGPDMRFEDAQAFRSLLFALFRPDLELTKTVDLADATTGDTLTYTVDVENVGTGAAADIELVDTKPDGAEETRSLANLEAADSATEEFTFTVPCSTADLTSLTNTATVTATNLLNNPEVDTSNNTDTASTTIHTPVMTLSKTATPSVNAGEAITYTITYENTGSADAESVMITDTLPADVYYSIALDQGSDPAPDSVSPNADGTTTLTWLVGGVAASSGPLTVEYTARPSLLLLDGDSVTNDASLDFTDGAVCDYPTLTAAAPTGITEVPPSEDPRTIGFWKNHSELWTAEILARIQATDDRFDGADGSVPDGELSAAEVEAAMPTPGTGQLNVLRGQLLATYFNIATRRINAGTLIESPMTNRLSLDNVRDAAVFAMETLLLAVEPNRSRYANATQVLANINANSSEVY